MTEAQGRKVDMDSRKGTKKSFLTREQQETILGEENVENAWKKYVWPWNKQKLPAQRKWLHPASQAESNTAVCTHHMAHTAEDDLAM